MQVAACNAAVLIPFVALGAAAITGVSTVIGVLLANRAAQAQLSLRLNSDEEKARKAALRERLEELYQLIDQWAGSFVVHHVTLRRVMEGQLSYNQALDLQINRGTEVSSARMFTLAELYFSKCHSLFAEIKQCREEASGIQSEFKELHRHSGCTSGKHAAELTETLEHFNRAIMIYKKQLAEYAREV